MTDQILRVIIKTGDVARIQECSIRTASQTINDMRTFFKKIDKRCKMTFREYALFVQIPLDEFEPYRIIRSY